MPPRGDKEGWHNKGQEDASEGKYSPPHDNLKDNLFASYDDKEIEDRKSYREGWRHTTDQESSSSGPCFLTTACVKHAGLADDCHELSVLRSFRDNILDRTKEGQALVAEYYARAPRLVCEIEKRNDKNGIYEDTFKAIQQVVRCIEAGENQVAIAQYAQLVREVEEEIEKGQLG